MPSCRALRAPFLAIVLLNCIVAADRHALVIGNSKYASLPPLTSSPIEVQLMTTALEKAGFEVTVLQDAAFSDLLRAESGFLAKLKPADVGLMYYAGYVMQFNADNYLIPVDFNPAGTAPVPNRAVSVSRIQSDLDDKQAGLKLILLEPSQAPALIAQASGTGVANPDTGESNEIIFAFAVYPNQPIPAHGPGAGNFTKYLAETIPRPGVPLIDVFTREASKAGLQVFFQPKLSAMIGFYFIAPPPPGPATNHIGDVRRNRKDRQDYVWIPAGDFTMGCVEGDKRCKPEEKPPHRVRISHSFWMAANDVDFDAYNRYMDDDKKRRKWPEAPFWDRGRKARNYPITSATWDQADSFCKWVGGRLPTEAEWEYAARAGRENEIYPLNDENSRDKANFHGVHGNDTWEYTSPKGSFDPNPWRLYDMAGNVWQWCADWFSADYYTQSPATDPKGPVDGKEHVTRGGSFDSDPHEHLRISFRNHSPKGGNNVGFRCVLEDTKETRDQFVQ